MTASGKRRRRLQPRILLALSLAAALMAMTVLGIGDVGKYDLLGYWGAARLLARQSDPYNVALLGQLEARVFAARIQAEGRPVVSWNPPWLLVLLLPLAVLPFDLAARVWLVGNLAVIVAAALVAGRLLALGSERGVVLALIAALWFGQSLANVQMGQVTTLLLWGVVLCAWFLAAGREEAAGAALWLVAIKPHITYLVLLLVLAWALTNRRWRLFQGAAWAGVAWLAVLSLLWPVWWQSYLALITGHSFLQYSTATIGGVLYAWTGNPAGRYLGILALPFLPWLLRSVPRRGWMSTLNVALLLSVPIAPYGYGFDHIVLIPVAIELLSWLTDHQIPRLATALISTGLAATYLVLLAMLLSSRYYHAYTWVPIVLGVLYWAGDRARSRSALPVTIAVVS